MQHLTIVDSLEPEAVAARCSLGAQLSSALQAATTDPSRMLPLWTAFSRGEPVPAADLRRAVSETFVGAATSQGLLLPVDIGEDEPLLRGSVCIVAAELAGELRWIASDFPWNEDDPVAVTGPGEATATLLAAIPDGNRRRVLDMGCGSGALGVRLTAPRGALTSSDVNPRALALTELTAALNDRTVRTAQSDFADQLAGEFDLIVCNPPFVLGRPSGRTTFRDSRDGSGHAALGVDLAPLLDDGGLAVYLANWEYQLAGSPTELLARELTGCTGCDVLILERAVVPAEEYVQVWSSDPETNAAWAAGFAARDVTHLGTGLVLLYRRGAATQTVTVVQDFHTPRVRLADVVRAWMDTSISQR